MQGKYRNIKAEYNGEIFDSRKEMRRAVALGLLERAGQVKDVRKQVKFVLQEAFEYRGEYIREITYIADFVYYDVSEGCWVVEDVKSDFTRKDAVYSIKKKLFKAKYPEYKFVEYV